MNLGPDPCIHVHDLTWTDGAIEVVVEIDDPSGGEPVRLTISSSSDLAVLTAAMEKVRERVRWHETTVLRALQAL